MTEKKDHNLLTKDRPVKYFNRQKETVVYMIFCNNKGMDLVKY